MYAVCRLESFLLDNFLESRIDDAIGLHGGDGNVEHPEEDEDSWRDCLEELGSSQLTTNGGMPSGDQDKDGETGLNTENGNGETQAGKNISH